jgi:hypothetical protein
MHRAGLRIAIPSRICHEKVDDFIGMHFHQVSKGYDNQKIHSYQIL